MKINIKIKDKVKDEMGYYTGQKIRTMKHSGYVTIIGVTGEILFNKRLEMYHRRYNFSKPYNGVVVENTTERSSESDGIKGYCINWSEIIKE